MALTGVIIETPALVEVGLPIQVTEYDIQREINAAGAFAVAFPASQTLANQVRSRWRVSIIEEGRSGYLLRRGVVTNRNYQVAADGTGILTLAGFTRLYELSKESTHVGLAFGNQTVENVVNSITGETFTVPASASTRNLTVTFNDTSKLAALFTAADLGRFNVRETFNEDGFELVDQDDVPDSGFRFVNVEQAGPELGNAAANGMGLIAGTPTIGYSGADLATRIIPKGADFDGNDLTLASATVDTPYDIRTGTNPDSTSYYYLQDDDAEALYGVIEFQYVRTDVKNPSDDAGTRQTTANALYAVSAGELIKRRYDVISFAAQIANGNRIDALPGDRVRIVFRGRARTPSGMLTWQDIDQHFLIAKRRDAGSAAGVRGVSFTLTAPEVPQVIPSLPDAVPIPPAPRDPPDPPEPRSDDPGADDPGSDDGGDGGGDTPPFEDPGMPNGNDLPIGDPRNDGEPSYPPCCEEKTRDVNDVPPVPGNCAGTYLFEWDAGVDGDGEPTYVLDVDTDPTFATQTQYSTSGHSQSVSGLVAGTTYYVRIESHFADASVQISAAITVRF